MLSVKERQKRLKALGFYTGKIDGKELALTKKAYLKLQKKYFPKSEQDSKYGPKTEILLKNAYNCRDLKYFKLEEFKCCCNGKYCTGYPEVMNRTLLKKLDKTLRPKYGAMTILSGVRCNKRNAEVGGVSNSRHKLGKAVDFQCEESRKGPKSRDAIVKYCLKHFRYSYGNTPGMGASIHVDV